MNHKLATCFEGVQRISRSSPVPDTIAAKEDDTTEHAPEDVPMADLNESGKAVSIFIRGFISCGWLLSILVAALLFSAIIGGISFAAATEFNLKLVEKLVCPEASSITFRLGAYESDFEFPSASNPIGSESGGRSMTIYCLREGEIAYSGNSLLVRTLALVFSGYFLACFLALLIVSSVLQWWIRRRLSAA